MTWPRAAGSECNICINKMKTYIWGQSFIHDPQFKWPIHVIFQMGASAGIFLMLNLNFCRTIWCFITDVFRTFYKSLKHLQDDIVTCQHLLLKVPLLFLCCYSPWKSPRLCFEDLPLWPTVQPEEEEQLPQTQYGPTTSPTEVSPGTSLDTPQLCHTEYVQPIYLSRIWYTCRCKKAAPTVNEHV